MTRTLEAAETVKVAVADLNSKVEAFDFWTVEHNEAWKRYEVAVNDDYDFGYDDDDDDYEHTAEYRAWKRDTERWLREHSNDPADPNYSEIYSDVYKDLYGVRPRW